MKQTRNNVSREPTININRSTKIFVNFLTAIKYFRKWIFPHFLVAIADLTHPLSNNRSSIRIIGCSLLLLPLFLSLSLSVCLCSRVPHNDIAIYLPALLSFRSYNEVFVQTGNLIIADGSVEFCEATPIGLVYEPKVSLYGRETDHLRSACRCVA